MKNSLAFDIPFSGFTTTTFINCFAATYMFLEGIVGDKDFKCKKRDGQPCDGCGNCCSSTLNVQERWFFLFDTVCGRSSLRWRFDGEPTDMERMIGTEDSYEGDTDDNVDFLFGFAGYEYRKVADPAEFKSAIIASIDAGKPVIAKVKTGEGRVRVIVGYDGETLLCPDFANAQRKPEHAPALGELDVLWIIGGKVKPRYTFADGLKRIVRIMQYNIDEKLWDAYFEKIGWYGWHSGDGMNKASMEERKARMKRVAETMWHTFNTHNFAEVFRGRHCEELKNPALDAICKEIGTSCYGYTHDLAAALIGLEQQLDWSNDWFACGFAETVELTLKQIKKNDIRVLELIKQMLAILQGNRVPPAETPEPISAN